MTCMFCEEPILDSERRADIHVVAQPDVGAHSECGLRQVLGGIGHLIDHAHFCGGVGPDAGLDYRTSALMVEVWVRRKGIDAATATSQAQL